MSYPNRSHGQSTAGMSPDEAQRVRYMAHVERRARPPTFRPLTIVVVVLSLGLFVIGLVMIVIAHWPGVSGGDSLKIAGGVLLSVGAVIFIISMIVTCMLRNRERERFEKSIASMQASRSNISVISRRTPMTTTPTPSVDARPGKSILKKTPSTSTYGRGSVFGEDDSGQNSFGQGHGIYEHGSSNSDTSAGKYEVYRIETLPDPSMARGRGKNGSLPQSGQMMNLSGSGAGMGSMDHSSSMESESLVPTPVRHTKKRRAQSPSVASGRTNPSYSQDQDEINVSKDSHQRVTPPRHNDSYDQQPQPGRQMKQYSYDGYDMYSDDTSQPAVPQPYTAPPAVPQPYAAPPAVPQPHPAPPAVPQPHTGDAAESAIPQPIRKKKGDRRRQQSPGFQNQAFTPPEADLGGVPVVQQTVTTTTQQSTSTTRQTRPAQGINTSTASNELRIKIKAQSGTAVHITPTGTRVEQAPRTMASSQSSVETEI